MPPYRRPAPPLPPDENDENALDLFGNLVRAADMPADPDLRRMLGEVRARQIRDAAGLKQLTPEKLAFQLMRIVPREHWNTPWRKIDPELYERGVKNPRYASEYLFNLWHPGLKKLTPGKTILELFNLQPAVDRARSEYE